MFGDTESMESKLPIRRQEDQLKDNVGTMQVEVSQIALPIYNHKFY